MMLVLQWDDGTYCGDCSVELGTRLVDGCVQCRCVELVMVHHTFHGSDLLKLPPECNKWSAYIWSLNGVQGTCDEVAMVCK